MRSMRRVLKGLAVVTIALGADRAPAAIPSSVDGKFYACVLKKGMRLIDTDQGQTCSALETMVSWSEKGPRGPAGPPGQAGPPGPAGPRLVVVERNVTYGGTEVVGPFVSSGVSVEVPGARGGAAGNPIVTYWKDGVFITRNTSTGMEYPWAFVAEFLWDTPDCGNSGGSAYLATYPPVPLGHVFASEGAGNVNGIWLQVTSSTKQPVLIQARGPFGYMGCTSVTPYTADVYPVARVNGVCSNYCVTKDGPFELTVEQQ